MIGPKTFDKMGGMALDQLDAYAKQIDAAFLKSDDGKLKVSLSFDLCVSTIKPGGIDVDCTIGFTADRIKNKISETVIENQEVLPL